MDILRPTLIRIGGRVYRKNLIQEQAYQHEEEEDFCAGRECCVRGDRGAVRMCYRRKHRHWGPRELLLLSLTSMCTRTCLSGGVRCSRGGKVLCIGP